MRAKILTQDSGQIVMLRIPETNELFVCGTDDENIVCNVYTHDRLWGIFGRLSSASDKESWRAGWRKVGGVRKYLPGVGFCAQGTIDIMNDDLAFLRRLRDFVSDCRARGIDPTDAMRQSGWLQKVAEGGCGK